MAPSNTIKEQWLHAFNANTEKKDHSTPSSADTIIPHDAPVWKAPCRVYRWTDRWVPIGHCRIDIHHDTTSKPGSVNVFAVPYTGRSLYFWNPSFGAPSITISPTLETVVANMMEQQYRISMLMYSPEQNFGKPELVTIRMKGRDTVSKFNEWMNILINLCPLNTEYKPSGEESKRNGNGEEDKMVEVLKENENTDLERSDSVGTISVYQEKSIVPSSIPCDETIVSSVNGFLETLLSNSVFESTIQVNESIEKAAEPPHKISTLDKATDLEKGHPDEQIMENEENDNVLNDSNDDSYFEDSEDEDANIELQGYMRLWNGDDYMEEDTGIYIF
jgi:hypothetical protein